MATDDIFVSAVRSSSDLAGVFEFDGETGYFYLYKIDGEEGQKILDSIHIFSGDPDFTESDVSICWNADENQVGFFIKSILWALFDVFHHTSYGGNYKLEGKPMLPLEIVRMFNTSRYT